MIPNKDAPFSKCVLTERVQKEVPGCKYDLSRVLSPDETIPFTEILHRLNIYTGRDFKVAETKCNNPDCKYMIRVAKHDYCFKYN